MRELGSLMDREKAAKKQVKWAGARLLVRDGKDGVFREIKKQDKREKFNIISWNINGLIRKLSDTDFLELINSYDFFLFSETWASTSFNLELNGFQSFHIPGIKGNNSKQGRKSGGISMYYKTEYTVNIFVVEKFNNGIMWIRIASELFHFQEDIFVIFLQQGLQF